MTGDSCVGLQQGLKVLCKRRSWINDTVYCEAEQDFVDLVKVSSTANPFTVAYDCDAERRL